MSGAGVLALVALLAVALPVVGVRVRRRARHEADYTQKIVDMKTGDLCLHEVCSCGAAKPCGDKRWSPRFSHS